MTKRLVLFSQPTPEIFERLKTDLFPTFLLGKAFAYMPSDGSDLVAKATYTKPWEDFALSCGANFIYIDNSQRGESALVESQKILNSDILIITGGNTYKLLKHLRESGIDKTILEFWQKDNVVLSGFSAGALVLTPSIEVAKFENTVGLDNAQGLSIVDFEIWPHYIPNEQSLVIEYEKKKNLKLTLIRNDEVLVIDK